jgi:hypothetical protein
VRRGWPCDILFWEAVPGEPLDDWKGRQNPAEHLEQSLALMRQWVPWEYDFWAPLPEHVQGILGAATQNPAVAHRFAYGYANPTDFANWLMNPARTQAYLASVANQATT